MSEEDQANFVAITGCADPEMAAQWLEMAAGDLHAAVALYMDNQGGSAAASTGGNGGGGGGSSPGKRGGGMYDGDELDEDGVRKADETKRQRLIDHQPHRQHHLATAGFVSPNGGGAMAGMAGAGGGAGSSVNPFRDFGAETRGAFGRGGSPWEAPDAGIGALFAPPMKLLFKGAFIEARAAAKQGKRWLLVNIQSDAEFASHVLNRDVFKDELATLIADGFVFWQAQFTVPEARSFLDRYHQSVTQLPLLGILDPRTQRLLWSHTGKIEAEEMAAKLSEICSTYSLDDNAAMPLPPPPQPPRPVQAYDRSEDEQLALALAASMQEEEERRKKTGKGEVVDVDGSGDEAGEDSEVEVVGVSSPGKKEGKKQDVSVYTVDDDEDAGQGGNNKDATTMATVTAKANSSSSGSSSPPEAAAAAPAYLAAPLDEEPAAGTPECTRIQVRLPDGKRLQRVFPLTAPVASLYRFVHEAYVSAQEGGAAKGFDLTTMFPAASLKGGMERGESLGQAELANSAVSLIWTG